MGHAEGTGGPGAGSSGRSTNLARRSDQCGPQDSNLQPRDSSAPAFPRGLDYLILLDEAARIPVAMIDRKPRRVPRRPGARRRGLLLGLTPLVSEPSWPPRPGQAWLRIAVLQPQTTESQTTPIREAREIQAKRSRDAEFRFPAIHPVRNRRLPSGATLSLMSPLLCR